MRSWLAVACIACVACSFRSKGHAENARREAGARPLDAEAVGAWLKTLPVYLDGRIVDGDLVMTEEQAARWLATTTAAPYVPTYFELSRSLSRASGAAPADPPREVVLELDAGSFRTEQRGAVHGAVQQAAAAWREVCPGCLPRLSVRSSDAPPPPSRVRAATAPAKVRVRRAADLETIAAAVDIRGTVYEILIADAFFEGSPPSLVHAVGHVLGYSHTSSPGRMGCYEYRGTWHTTASAANSVMTAPCGSALPSRYFSGEFSENDERSHRASSARVYGDLAAAPGAGGAGKLVVRSDGAEALPHVLEALIRLSALEVLATVSVPVDGETSRCEVAKRAGLSPREAPGCEPRALELLERLNPSPPGADAAVPPGTRRYVDVPDVAIERRDETIRVDPASTAGRERKAELQRADASAQVVGRDRAGLELVTTRGYAASVPMPSGEAATYAIQELTARAAPDVRVDFVPDRAPPQLAYAARLHPAKFWDECATREGTARGAQGVIAKLAGRTQEVTRCPMSSIRPELVLFDTPIAPHPDLPPSLFSERPPAAFSPNVTRQQCTTGADPHDIGGEHHGTMMAGIIASLDNDFGFVGVDPEAVITRADPSTEKIVELLSMRTGVEGGFSVYVYASKYDYLPSSTLHSPEARFKQKEIARKIRDSGSVWVVAAGQEDADEPIALTMMTPMGPMNLGDLENVVVVSACKKCDERTTARLWESANYSPTLVHVAAPGVNVPAPISATDYGLATGTSPATAFVAGVVSAMMSCYPLTPSVVKARLQYTARPPMNDDDRDRISGGFVDPEVALLDPKKDYVDRVAGEVRWCSDRIEPTTIGGAKASIETKDLWRVIKLPRGPGEQRDPYFLFARKRNEKGEYVSGAVNRIGPVTFPDLNAALVSFHADNGAVVTRTYAEIEDVLVRWGRRNGGCALPGIASRSP